MGRDLPRPHAPSRSTFRHVFPCLRLPNAPFSFFFADAAAFVAFLDVFGLVLLLVCINRFVSARHDCSFGTMAPQQRFDRAFVRRQAKTVTGFQYTIEARVALAACGIISQFDGALRPFGILDGSLVLFCRCPRSKRT